MHLWTAAVGERAKGGKGEAETEAEGDISISSPRLGFPIEGGAGGDLLSGINLKINKLVCVQGYGFTVAHRGSAK